VTAAIKATLGDNAGFSLPMLRRVRSRDPQETARFFEQYYEPVRSYVTRLLRNEFGAEDLTQEIFLRLYVNLHRLKPEGNPKAWVFTLATNVVRDYWRSAASSRDKRNVSLEAVPPLPSRAGWEPDAIQRRLEERRTVRSAMATLSQPDREIIRLRAYEELDSPSVARIEGISAGAARQRYSRAVRRLRERIRDMTAEASAGLSLSPRHSGLGP
jgi:RNA polymerase sigma-70 factor (ECF subfamily)